MWNGQVIAKLRDRKTTGSTLMLFDCIYATGVWPLFCNCTIRLIPNSHLPQINKKLFAKWQRLLLFSHFSKKGRKRSSMAGVVSKLSYDSERGSKSRGRISLNFWMKIYSPKEFFFWKVEFWLWQNYSFYRGSDIRVERDGWKCHN